MQHEKNEDIQLELGRLARPSAVKKKNPLEDKAISTCPCGRPTDELCPVFINTLALRAIKEHVFADPEREVGGVLVGEYCRSGNRYYIQVNDIIRADMAESTGVSLTFTHDAWEHIYAQLAERDSRERIIGWYHSHPQLGVFLSKEDEFIHQHYFADPYHVALVVDPKLGEWAVFEWSGESLVRAAGFYVFGGRSSEDEVRKWAEELCQVLDTPAATARGPVQAGSHLRVGGIPTAVWALLVLLVISQIGLWFAVIRGARASSNFSYLNAAIQILSIGDLTDGERLLRLELARNSENSRALLEFRRVSAALADSKVSGSEGEQLDRINLQLAMASHLAGRLPQTQEPSFLKEIESSFTADKRRPETTAVAPDYVKEALEIYKRAAGTRRLRIERAYRVKEIVRSLGSIRAAQSGLNSDAWYERAVRWLRGEHIREIAYGIICREETYDKLFRRLSEAEQREVKRICASLAKSK
ncbi:MAG: Mov34/MPN/PAD-1 family protein [Armatimonadota bacterium]|nr:Mov34/MPN/PAD-1 family protein [Armatimonadota bacterium]